MTTPEERIRDLVRARGIAEPDAEELLAAVRPQARKSKNPFERWSGEVTSIVGLVVAVAAFATSRLGLRYDGALDLHDVSKPVETSTAIVDQLVAFPLTALVFWGAARVLSKRARFIDVLGVVGVARIPTVLVAVPLSLLVPHLGTGTRLTPALLGVIVLGLAGIGFQITLLVFGFLTSTGARSGASNRATGGKTAGAFIAALVVAEIVTKAVLALVT